MPPWDIIPDLSRSIRSCAANLRNKYIPTGTQVMHVARSVMKAMVSAVDQEDMVGCFGVGAERGRIWMLGLCCWDARKTDYSLKVGSRESWMM